MRVDDRLAKHLRTTIEAGVVVGSFAITLFAPGLLLVKLLVLGLIGLTSSWVVAWHLGYRRGRNGSNSRSREGGS